MSWAATAYVKPLRVGPTGDTLTRDEKFLLLILADYYNDEARAAWPSAARLAEECLMSKRGVWRVLKRLRDKGVLARVARRGEKGALLANAYQFPALDAADRDRALQHAQHAQHAQAEAPPAAPPSPNGATPSATAGTSLVTVAHSPLVTASHYPSDSVGTTLVPQLSHQPSDRTLAPEPLGEQLAEHSPSLPPRVPPTRTGNSVGAQGARAREDAVIEAFLAGLGRPPRPGGAAERAAAADLLNQGATPALIRACTAWLLSDPYYGRGLSPPLGHVQERFTRWRAAGCPTVYAAPVAALPVKPSRTLRVLQAIKDFPYASYPLEPATAIRETRHQLPGQFPGRTGDRDPVALMERVVGQRVLG